MTENPPRKQRGRPWRPGQSGNPAGKPKGARHRATIAVEQLLDNEAEALTRKAIELALDGDVTALRLVLERLAPPRRERPVMVDLPEIASATDAVRALAALVAATAEGSLAPGEAAEFMRLVDGYLKELELTEFELRLAALEAKGTE